MAKRKTLKERIAELTKRQEVIDKKKEITDRMAKDRAALEALRKKR